MHCSKGFRWLVCVWVVFGLARARVSASDWPQWRGPSRDGQIATGDFPLKTLARDPRLIWRRPSGPGIASPVVSEGRLYHFDAVSGREVLHAMEASTGNEQWRAEVDEAFADEQGPAGPRCTPVVDGDRVYAQSCRGRLVCLNSATGARVWSADFQKDFGAVLLGEDSKVPGAAEHGYTGAPLVFGDQLIVCPGGTNGAGLVSFQKKTGAVLWKSQNDLASYAAPFATKVAGLDQIFCFTVEGLLGLHPADGHLLWRVPLKTSYGRNVTTPLVIDNWVFVGSYQAGLMGVELTVDGPSVRAESRWVNKAAAMNFSSPVASGHQILGLGPNRNLVAIDDKSGKILWSRDGFWGGASSSAFGAFILAGDRLLLWTDAGQAILVRVSSTGCEELGRLQVCGRNWCHPALVGTRLFVRDGFVNSGTLYAVDLAPPSP